MTTSLERLERLEAVVASLTAAKGDHISSQPLRRTAADRAGGGGGEGGSKGGGRKVASKAGEKRYGLPIGTPLGQGKSGGKRYDRKTAYSYNRVLAGKTPAEIKANVGRMSNTELERATKALFSFASKNERDNAARMALVRELADRGIDAHKFGYKGAPVVVNPNPKKDPVAKAKEVKAKAAERKVRDAEREDERQDRARERSARERDRALAAEEREAKKSKAEQEREEKAREAERLKKQRSEQWFNKAMASLDR